MLTAIAEGKTEAYREAVLSFAMKLQQYTSPVMAKGLEDTSFYVYTRLVSLNEVGGDPRVFGVSVMGVSPRQPRAATQLAACDAGDLDA